MQIVSKPWAAALCVALASCAGGLPEAPPPAAAPVQVPAVPVAGPAADAAIAGANAERSARGLPPLRPDDRLARAAQGHSDDMARTGRLGHAGSDGSDIGERVRAAGYAWCAVAENVAAGQSDAAAVVQSWMGSPGHRANILNGDMVDVAVADRVAADGTRYWTMVLAAPC